MDDKKEEIQTTQNNLDGSDTVVEQTSTKLNDENSLESEKNVGGIDSGVREKPKLSLAQRVEHLVKGVNIYLLLFILVLLLAGIAGFASYRASKKESSVTLNGQTLSDKDLQNLKSNDTSVGDPKQTLTIASNAIFNGRVLVKDGLDVAGTIRVGNALSLPGISVSGTSAFENVQIGNNLSVGGNQAVQGTLTIQKSLTVGGSASFAGTITAPALSIDRLILNQDLQINRHVDAGGATPRAWAGSAVGGCGTISISGTDTAGTINVNFGCGPTGGTIANVTFSNSFTQTPHVVITPVGSSCGNLQYFVTRTNNGFTIGTNNSGSGSCSFDYIAID